MIKYMHIDKRGILMAEKHIKRYPNGAVLIYYRQNINSTTDVTIMEKLKILREFLKI